MDQNRAFPPNFTATVTANQRARFPARYIRKDARTLALRLTYGSQSKLTNTVTQGPTHLLAIGDDLEYQAVRQSLLKALASTGYDSLLRERIVADFDRLRRRREA